MNAFKRITQLCLLSALPLFVQTASAIKFEIPKELQDDVAAQQASEEAEVQQAVDDLYEGKTEAAEGAGLNFGSAATDEAATVANAPAEDSLDESSFMEFDPNSPTGTALGDEGLITGQIFDKETSQPLSGVAILIEGTDIGSITDGNGNYTLGPAPAGVYTLNFVKTGYIEANVTEFEVVAGESKEFGFALPPRPAEMSDDVFELQDFVVTADEANSMMMQLDLQKLSVTQLDVMSAEEFSKYAASDIADAVKNIAGVSLSDGKYAVIRGLNDRYSVTRLNRNTMPSPDPDRAAVPLDVFPTGIFEAIETRKTNSADLPGNASGGVIDLRLLSLPEERVLKFSTGVGFNTEAQDIWLSTPRSGRGGDYLGDGAQYRDYNEEVSYEDQFDLTNPDEIDRFIETTSNRNIGFERFAPIKKDPVPDMKFSLLYGETFEFGQDHRFGLVFAAQQRSESRTVQLDINSTGENGSAGAESIFSSGDYIVNEWGGERTASSLEGQLSGLLGLSYGYSDSHVIDFNVLFSRTGQDGVLVNRGGFVYGDGGQDTTLTFAEAYAINPENPSSVVEETDTDPTTPGIQPARALDYVRTEYTQRTLWAYQLAGEHQFPSFEPLTLNWSLLYADNEQDEPDTFDTRGPFPPTRIKRLTTQDSIGALLSSRLALGELWELLNAGRGTDLEIGGSLDRSEREFEQRQKITETSTSVAIIDGVPNLVLERETIDQGITGQADGERNIDSIYAMVDTRPTSKLQIVAGVRGEWSEISYDGFGSAPSAGNYSPELIEGAPIDQTDWIPSVNVSYDLTDELKLRFAYSETVARPTYRELQPFPILNALTNEIEVGNPGYMAQIGGLTVNPVLPEEYRGLETADVTNLDARLEWYPGNSFYAIGFFAKDVGNPIERVEAFGQDSDLQVFTYINNENSADLYGLEVEWQQNIGDLFGEQSLEFLNIGGNFTYIDAEIDRSAAELLNAGLDGDVDILRASDSRPLYDQPDVIANLFINLDFVEQTGSSFTLSVNHTGDRLVTAINSDTMDVYEDAVTTMNFVYSQEIRAVEGLKFNFSIKNLTNPEFSRSTKVEDNDLLLRDENGNTTSDVALEDYRKGVSYSVSVSYEF